MDLGKFTQLLNCVITWLKVRKSSYDRSQAVGPIKYTYTITILFITRNRIGHTSL